ncbi:ommochrome-binding protein-like [Pararge aegeria]|uniref:ommochrome-binding protein-like n=1 Tax=Pararge aegeria TaxID=116150 RepID=UPI0019CFA756|nr:ommochrome-binding protein-like [Pararge aegeria]XP_039749550.1 ommochrome-binding protein-like [Pararge aegeria]
MKFIILLSLLAYANARIPIENCDGIVVHNIKHEQQVLKNDIKSPYQLALDYNTNTLFFSYSSSDPEKSFESAYINLKTNEFKIITGINGGFANAVDEKQNIVYLGGRDGIYQFDYETKVATHIDGTDHNIWQLFYKKDLYYSKYPEEHVYIFKDHQSHRVPELIDTQGMLVAVDNFDNIYFSNSSGLFVHKKIKNYISYVGDYNINGFTCDVNGKIFFSTPDGLFYIDDSTKKVEKLTSIETVYGVAIEADGSIIYASEDSLIRLKPTKTYCYSNEKISL